MSVRKRHSPSTSRGALSSNDLFSSDAAVTSRVMATLDAMEVGLPSLDMEVPYEDDRVARDLVRANPDGMSREDVSAVTGLTEDQLRLIEEVALRKLQRCRHNL